MFECFVLMILGMIALMILGMIVLMIPLFGVSTQPPPIEEVWFYVVWVQQKKINIENTVRKRVIILKSKQSLQQTIRRTTRTISPSYPCAVSSRTALLSSQRLVHPTDLT